MPSTDGAIGLGLGTWTLLKAPGLRSPRFDTKHVKRSCGATLPSRHTRTSPAKGAKITDVLTPAPRMRSTPKLAGWSPWVDWWPGRSRVDLFCHETRAVGHLTQVSYASLGIATQGGVGGG